jgi:hypothetical protein
MFNFFTVLAGITLAGIGATLQGAPTFSAIGAVLGMLLALLSFVFWKLDQRVAFLVKHAEQAHEQAEAKLLPPEMRLFCEEPGAHISACQAKPAHRRHWTFGNSLRVTFGAMAAIGLASTVFSGLRLAGVVKLEKPEAVLKTDSAGEPGNSGDGAKRAEQTGTRDGPVEVVHSRTNNSATAQKNLPDAAAPSDSIERENSSVQSK